MRTIANHRRIVIAILSVVFCPSQAIDSPAAEPVITVATTRFGGLDLMDISLDGKTATRLTKDEKGAVSPSWSPDGKRLAYVSFSTGTSKIFSMNADGSEVKNLSGEMKGDRNPVYSPDGKHIAFSSWRESKQDVFVIDADGSNTVNITGKEGFAADPAWSPDGKRLGIVSSRTGAMRLWLINLDGSDPVDVVKRDQIGAIYPTWSADGKQVIFGQRGANGKVHMFIANIDGGGLQQLTDGDKMCSYATWSPDGQYVAYIRFQSWPNTIEPTAGKEDKTPLADLMLYDTIEEKHTVVSSGDITMWGPRPAWRPVEAK